MQAEIKSIESIIDDYLAKIKVGTDYVCTCCHRMMETLIDKASIHGVVTSLSPMKKGKNVSSFEGYISNGTG